MSGAAHKKNEEPAPLVLLISNVEPDFRVVIIPKNGVIPHGTVF